MFTTVFACQLNSFLINGSIGPIPLGLSDWNKEVFSERPRTGFKKGDYASYLISIFFLKKKTNERLCYNFVEKK